VPPAQISLADRQAIIDLVNAYAFALDTGDHDGVAAAFTADGYIKLPNGSEYRGSDQLRQFVSDAMKNPTFRGHQHNIEPLYFEAVPGGYKLSSYWMILFWQNGTPPSVEMMGYSDDTVTKVDGEWRIKERIVGSWTSETSLLAG
jgi:hypothetical protein